MCKSALPDLRASYEESGWKAQPERMKFMTIDAMLEKDGIEACQAALPRRDIRSIVQLHSRLQADQVHFPHSTCSNNSWHLSGPASQHRAYRETE